MSDNTKQLRVFFVFTSASFFLSHFLSRAKDLIKNGYSVSLVGTLDCKLNEISKHGIDFYELKISRRSLSPLASLETCIDLFKILKKHKPDIVHNVAWKPIIFSSVVAKLVGISFIVNAPVGKGFFFTDNSALVKFLRFSVTILLKLFLNPPNSFVVVENKGHLSELLEKHFIKAERSFLIRGAGVDINLFKATEEPELPVRLTLVSRMLWDKGVGEFVDAVRILRIKKIDFRATLVGQTDDQNPASIDVKIIKKWVGEGLVEFLGQQKNIEKIWAKSHISVLPSYHEGLPKTLIEAASCSKPIVATKIDGCMELVKDNKNGLLVPVQESLSLSYALEKLIHDKNLRLEMGANGRQSIEMEFSNEIVNQKNLDMYTRITQKLKTSRAL